MVLGYYRQELEFIGKGTLPLWAFRYVVVWFSVLAALIYVLMIVNIFVKPASERDASQRGETEVVID
ncbi:MAG: hypothetical protein O7A03_09520 [Alphaproteobacteria bacterium]|nr:hypothetical protein [Alphaproteobacteria bacterium]